MLMSVVPFERMGCVCCCAAWSWRTPDALGHHRMGVGMELSKDCCKARYDRALCCFWAGFG